jgi:hypothetical protein
MNKIHRESLERAGWKVGNAAEFLELSDVEAALVEAKVALGDAVLPPHGDLGPGGHRFRAGSEDEGLGGVTPGFVGPPSAALDRT